MLGQIFIEITRGSFGPDCSSYICEGNSEELGIKKENEERATFKFQQMKFSVSLIDKRKES